MGREGGDLSRHDKWLCMMCPRLKLLHGCPRYYGYKDTLQVLDIVHGRLLARQSGEDTSRNSVALVWDEYIAQAADFISEKHCLFHFLVGAFRRKADYKDEGAIIFRS